MYTLRDEDYLPAGQRRPEPSFQSTHPTQATSGQPEQPTQQELLALADVAMHETNSLVSRHSLRHPPFMRSDKTMVSNRFVAVPVVDVVNVVVVVMSLI